MVRGAALLVAITLLTQAAPDATSPTQLKVLILAPPNAKLRSVDDVQATVLGSTAPAKVVGLVTPDHDLILMLVLDLAGDVSVADRAKDALAAELEQLPSTVHVALLRAQDDLRVILDPTLDRAAVQTAIRSTPVSGRAALLNTVETAVTLGDAVLAKSDVRFAILYVTDSSIGNYREDFTNPVINSSDAGDLSRSFPGALIQEKISKLDSTLLRHQAPLFIAHINYQSDRLSEAYLNGLRQLSTTTGAMALVCRSNAEISTAIHDVLTSIGGHYSLTLQLPEAPRKPVEVRLSFPGFEGAGQGFGYRSRFTVRKH